MTSNVRFYILAASVALSIFIPSWLRLQTSSDQLLFIRTEQVFGFVCLLYWYAALIISPLKKAVGPRFNWQYLVFSRRALGVSAAYFALLHVIISLWGQIGGISSLGLLPQRFVWSIVFGIIGLIILLAMATTSFDKIIERMGFRNWKWLHRLGYIGGVLALLHVWIIGTHVAYVSFQTVFFILLAGLFWLESQRLASILSDKYTRWQHQKSLIGVLLWFSAVSVLLALPTLLENNSDHHAITMLGRFLV